MKLLFKNYLIWITILFVNCFTVSNSQDFKLIFENLDGTKSEFNSKDLDKIDFNSLSKPYQFKIYTKSSGMKQHLTSEYNGINFSDIGFQMSKKIGFEVSNYFYEDIDSIMFSLDIVDEYVIKQLELDAVITNQLGNAWSLAFIDEFNVLITDKGGRLIFYNMSTKSKAEITNLPEIKDNGQGGLLDVKLHRNYAENNVIFLSHAISVGNNQTTVVTRALLNLENMSLENKQEIFRATPALNSGAHFGSRISFDQDNNLFISTGDRGNQSNAQNKLNHWGKIMRVTEFGEVPADNPYVSNNLFLPEIWSYGHRNVQGMDTHPITGELWAHEHGPQGGDELNLIKKGANYGWPLATFGINYNGTEITKDTTYPGCEDPITYWKPSIAPCGMTFVRDNKRPNEADILIGALAGQHIARVHLVDNKVTNQIRSLQNNARFRDVKQSPDGRIYAVTEDGRLIRLKEKK